MMTDTLADMLTRIRNANRIELPFVDMPATRLKMNVCRTNLQKLLDSLPALRNPTIASLAQEGWVAVETIIDEKVVREIIPQLKALGAEGIIEYPLNKVVY